MTEHPEKVIEAFETAIPIVRRFVEFRNDYMIGYDHNGFNIFCDSVEAYRKGSKLLGGTRYKLTNEDGRPYLRRLIYTSRYRGDDHYIRYPYVAVTLYAPYSLVCEKVPTGEKKIVKKPIVFEDKEEDVFTFRCTPINELEASVTEAPSTASELSA